MDLLLSHPVVAFEGSPRFCPGTAAGALRGSRKSLQLLKALWAVVEQPRSCVRASRGKPGRVFG